LIDEAIARSHGDAKARKDLEGRLAAVLKSDSTPAAKDLVCRRLGQIGTDESVAPLAALLADEGLAPAARYALERIAGPQSLAALRDAMPKAKGQGKVGLIHSLGVRHDDQAVALLIPLLADTDSAIAGAAASALGKIGAAEAAPALARLRANAAGTLKDVGTEASLALGYCLLEQGKRTEAAEVFLALVADPAEQVRAAALDGMVKARPAEAIDRLLKALGGDNLRLRGVAMRLVRQMPGEEASQRFAASLSRLPPAGKAALLEALGDRNDPAVRTAALEAMKSEQADVRLAALVALGSAGSADEVSLLVELATKALQAPEREAALASLNRLSDPATNAAILAQLEKADSGLRVTVIRSLVARRATVAVPALSRMAKDRDEAVRVETAKALQALAGPQAAGDLIRLLVASQSDEQRKAAEQALVTACQKIPDPERRAEAILAALDRAELAARRALLPALGSLGGAKALAVVHAAIQAPEEQLRDAGVEALANWPDARVAAELLDIAKSATKESHRVWALRGLARVVPRPGQLPAQEAFAILKQAWELARAPEDKRLILSRMAPLRVPECLAFVLSQFEDANFQPVAIATAAKLAEGMKQSHPKQSRAALEKVAVTTKDDALRRHVEQLLAKMKR
jgi:HEAT repeat protein